MGWYVLIPLYKAEYINEYALVTLIGAANINCMTLFYLLHTILEGY